MEKNTLKEKLKYNFDNLMSKGTIALISWLAILSAVIIISISTIVWLAKFNHNEDNFIKIIWMSLLRTLDPGTMGADEGSWGFLLSMLAVTLGGIFIISALIGIITTGLEQKLEELRKGKSKVIESNHTIILGWSEQVYTILSELIIANENKKKSCIVVMGDKDKIEMEDKIKDKICKSKKTKIVCRQGSPIDFNDLEIVNINTARSIIILSPEDDDPDSSVIKTILAIINHINRKKTPYHIIAEIRDPRNFKVAKIAGKDEVELILVGDLISRIIAQTCRQPGLSIIYTELLDFGGVEIYFKEEPTMAGKQFYDALFIYDDSAVIGIFQNDGIARLNPPMNTRLSSKDQLIVISENCDSIKLSNNSNYNIDKNLILNKKNPGLNAEKTLILGWNWRVVYIIKELDNYVPRGSKVAVVANFPDGEAIIKKECSGIVKNQSIKFINEDSTNRRVLDSLTKDNYNHIIVVCYDGLEQQQADAKTLITLLHLRDIAQKTRKNFSIVSEMLDIKNRNLAEIAKVNDFIVSDKMVSLLLSQVSENKYLNAVFEDLFDPEGSEIYLKPAYNYVKLNSEVNFYTIVESAAKKKEIAIGYKIDSLSQNAEKFYGVIINPVKSKYISFDKNDMIIIISETY